MNEYRLKYVYWTGDTIEEDFDIHHIDFNRKNNCIKNLVKLPKKLHADYHAVIKKLNNSIYNEYNVPKSKLLKLKAKLEILQSELDKHIVRRDDLIINKEKNDTQL